MAGDKKSGSSKVRKGRTNDTAGDGDSFRDIDDPDAWGDKYYGDYIKGLSRAESNALTHYTTSHFEEMNGYLRGVNDTISTKDKNAIRNATEALSKSKVPENIVAHRGMRPFGIFNDLRKVKPGTVYEDKGFHSTTLDKNKSFPGINVKIHVPKGAKGAYISKISAFSNEKELLLPPGTKFKILKVDARPPGSITVQVLK